MGRSPCCAKEGLNKGAWTAMEDKMLVQYVETYGEGKWRNIPKAAGLKRCGKSCRLRWLNYLRPDIKRGNISPDEEDLIIRLHKLLGNRWSLIAGRLPGRTDNEIKNYWNTNLSKKVGSSTAMINQQKQPSGQGNQKSQITDDNENGRCVRVKVSSPVAVRPGTMLKSTYISKENQLISKPQVSNDGDSWTLDDGELSMDFNVSDLIDFAEFGSMNVFGNDNQYQNAAGGSSSTNSHELVPESDLLLPGVQMAGSSNDLSCFASLFDPSAVGEDWLLDGDGGSMFGIF